MDLLDLFSIIASLAVVFFLLLIAAVVMAGLAFVFFFPVGMVLGLFSATVTEETISAVSFVLAAAVMSLAYGWKRGWFKRHK